MRSSEACRHQFIQFEHMLRRVNQQVSSEQFLMDPEIDYYKKPEKYGISLLKTFFGERKTCSKIE